MTAINTAPAPATESKPRRGRRSAPAPVPTPTPTHIDLANLPPGAQIYVVAPPPTAPATAPNPTPPETSTTAATATPATATPAVQPVAPAAAPQAAPQGTPQAAPQAATSAPAPAPAQAQGAASPEVSALVRSIGAIVLAGGMVGLLIWQFGGQELLGLLLYVALPLLILFASAKLISWALVRMAWNGGLQARVNAYIAEMQASQQGEKK